jgi:hypothetical protein
VTEQTTSRRIQLPDGDFLEPREDFAACLGITPRTVQRMDVYTVYIGNKAYVQHNKSMQIVAAAVHRPNEPEPAPSRPSLRRRSARGG